MLQRSESLKSIASGAYIHGFPMVNGHQTLISYAAQKPAIRGEALLQPMGDTPGVYGVPGSATSAQQAYPSCSFVWLDLRAEPMVLSTVSPEGDQFYSIQVMDLFMNRIGYIGPQVSGQSAAFYLVAPSGWQGEVPASINGILRSDTTIVQLICRPVTRQMKSGGLPKPPRVTSCIWPLSAFAGEPSPSRVATLEWPTHYLDGQDTLEFFRQLDFLLGFCPEPTHAKTAMERLTRKFVGSAWRFHSDLLSLVNRQLLQEGIQWGMQAIIDELRRVASIRDLFGPDLPVHRKHILKAAAARVGIYGSTEHDAYFLPHFENDSDANVAMLPLFYQSRMGSLPLSCGVDPECSVRGSYRVAYPRTELELPEIGAYYNQAGSGAQAVASPFSEDSEGDVREDERVPHGLKIDSSLSSPLRAEQNNIRVVQRFSLDSDGRLLLGNKRYVLHFAPSQLPPVNEFWSIATLDDKGFVVRCLLARGTIGNQDMLRFQEDGSLNLYIQAATPSADCETNWLPVEPGPFQIVLKLYAPRREILTGAWTAPLPSCVS